MRIMALDYGDKTVGVALTDELGMTAQPFETIFRERATKLRRTYARIEEIVDEKGVGEIVVGLPLLDDGSEGERCFLVRQFADDLKRRTKLPVYFEDERYTTAAADDILDEMNIAPYERKSYIDKIAASIILEQYLRKR